MDKCGALRARQLAKRLVRDGVDETKVTLGWAPGGDVPFIVEAVTSQGGVIIQVPREELPQMSGLLSEGLLRTWNSSTVTGNTISLRAISLGPMLRGNRYEKPLQTIT